MLNVVLYIIIYILFANFCPFYRHHQALGLENLEKMTRLKDGTLQFFLCPRILKLGETSNFGSLNTMPVFKIRSDVYNRLFEKSSDLPKFILCHWKIEPRLNKWYWCRIRRHFRCPVLLPALYMKSPVCQKDCFLTKSNVPKLMVSMKISQKVVMLLFISFDGVFESGFFRFFFFL